METEAWNIHIFDGLSGIQRGQLHFETIRVCRLDSSQTTRLKVLSQPFVSKRNNHIGMIARCAARNKSLTFNYLWGNLRTWFQCPAFNVTLAPLISYWPVDSHCNRTTLSFLEDFVRRPIAQALAGSMIQFFYGFRKCFLSHVSKVHTLGEVSS